MSYAPSRMLKYYESRPTLCTGQADNLKVETSTTRVWLSRCSVEDGEPYDNKITVERLRNGRWEEVETFQAE
jgi:hypothetical protein